VRRLLSGKTTTVLEERTIADALIKERINNGKSASVR
jgi:hypothetical protein